MDAVQRKKIYEGMIFLGVVITSLFGWKAVHQSIGMPGVDDWAFPVLWFSLLIPAVCIGVISFRQHWVIPSLLALVFLPTLFFVQAAGFMLTAMVGVLIACMGLFRMRRDMETNVNIKLRRIMHRGLGLLILGFSLVISSFYYFQIRDAYWEDLLPRFELGSASNTLLLQILGAMNPEFKDASEKNLTVDEFLQTVQKNQLNQSSETSSENAFLSTAGISRTPNEALYPSKVNGEVSPGVQALMMEQSRRQFSQVAGVSLTGQEKVIDVFSRIINQRLRVYFQPQNEEASSSLLPFVLAFILFFTLLPIGSLLSLIWIFLATCFFILAKRFGGVVVKTIMVEKEIIE